MPSRSGNGDGHRSNPRGSEERIAVGRILRPHGVRGELKVEVWSDVDDRFTVGDEMFLNLDGRSRKVRLEGVRPERGYLLVRLAGIADRDAADTVRNGRLEIDPEQVPEPPEGFYYHFQLEGCRCRDASAGDLGEVVELLEDGGGYLLRIRQENGFLLVPFVDEYLAEVDVAKKQIDLRCPPGLIELCTSKS